MADKGTLPDQTVLMLNAALKELRLADAETDIADTPRHHQRRADTNETTLSSPDRWRDAQEAMIAYLHPLACGIHP